MQFNFDNTYLGLPTELFSLSQPVPVLYPQLVIVNHSLVQELGIDISTSDNVEMASVFSGNTLPANAANIAQAYSGHQFGHFSRLGDGRAVLLGEQITPKGMRYDLQFKGSGVTPYSRRGDGRATLSAMLREYLMSEAMYALKIPTTRSLAVVTTGEKVYREQIQMGAVLTRVGASHIRVGTFEHIANFCEPETLAVFTNYVIDRHYPELARTENPALALLQKVIEQQIDLIVNWMRVGFIHGVMNTDNMTISGETIDYGPCAFMNSYNPGTVFSSIDTGGRYAYGNQPQLALWNLSRLAESLLPLIDSDVKIGIKKAQEVLNDFHPHFDEKYFQMLGRKIGILKLEEDDKVLINALLNWMNQNKADFTNTFIRLMYPELINDEIYKNESFLSWETALKSRWISEISPLEIMQQANPVYIPRNHIVEQVLNDASMIGEMTTFNEFLKRLSFPYSTIIIDTKYMQTPSEEDDKNYKTFCGT